MPSHKYLEELTMAVLTPLNQRDVWKSLACPFCGGRLLKEEKMHTLQQGWK